MKRRLADAVVVITGASSGIGRAAAAAFVRKGARVVLAARGGEALRDLAADLGRGGGTALAVPTDVTDEGAVRELARRAGEAYGRIDVWVNNAAVTLFGRIEEVPIEAFRRVVETNLMGYVHGARAALPFFRSRGTGVLIDVASMVSAVGQPYTSAYVASKWAVRGLGECLRMELALEGDHDIHVSTLLPASIDTPLFRHAANFTGRAVKPMDPVCDVERVASAIVALAERPRRERYVGVSGRLLAAQHAMAPGTTERLMARRVDSNHFLDEPAAASNGNLYEPIGEGAGASGGWKEARARSRGARRIGAGLAAAAGLAGLVWLGRSRM